MANIGKSVKLGVFTLAIMNVTAVVSLRGYRRGRVWCQFGILLFICGIGVSYTYGFGCGRVGGYVSGQAGRCIPVGRRGIRQESRFFGDLVTVDREYDLVSDGAYFRLLLR